jgi:hypothetical protein
MVVSATLIARPVFMFKARHFIQPQTRRARRGAAMFLIALWTMLWVSQAYAVCCGMPAGVHHESMTPAMEMHAVMQSEHEGCGDPQEPCCPQMFEEKLAVASAQPGVTDDGRLAQPALLQRALPMRLDASRARNDRVPDPPGPPDRVYLRLQRFLI